MKAHSQPIFALPRNEIALVNTDLYFIRKSTSKVNNNANDTGSHMMVRQNEQKGLTFLQPTIAL